MPLWAKCTNRSGIHVNAQTTVTFPSRVVYAHILRRCRISLFVGCCFPAKRIATQLEARGDIESSQVQSKCSLERTSVNVHSRIHRLVL